MKSTFSVLVLMSSAFFLGGCGSSSSSDSSVDISIPFKAVAGSEAIACGETISGLGNGAGGAGNSATISNFRMFLHDIKLITDQNIEIPVKLDAAQLSQNADVALLDFRDTEGCNSGGAANPNFNDTLEGSAIIDTAYTISSIQFTLGVPFDLNHKNQTNAEEPLRKGGLATGMTWSWQNGYKFVGFDVSPDGDIDTWHIHLGSTGCSVGTSDLINGAEPDMCEAYNRPVVTLSLAEYDLSEIAIQLDYAALVADNDLGQDNGGANGCMSGATDPECVEIFEKFGLNEEIEQSVFSIIEISENINGPI